MLNKLKQRKESGFTIIEVMIVLAIAGLIMIVVFLAVPALQRSSRNTQRKNDANNIASAMNEYAGNQGGSLPTNIGTSPAATSTSFDLGGALTAGVPANKVTVTLSGAFTSAPTMVAYSTSPAATTTSATIVTSATCNGNALASGTSRQFAVWFQVEPGTNQCVSS